jgi:hypothetical protein
MEDGCTSEHPAGDLRARGQFMILLFILALVCPWTHLAANPSAPEETSIQGVSVTGVPVFGGLGNLDTWVAVRFEVQTDTVGVQGYLEASWTTFDDPAITSTRFVDIPPFSRQQFFLYCECTQPYSKMETCLRLTDGKVLGFQSFPSVSHYGSAPVLVVGEIVNPQRAANIILSDPKTKQPIQMLESPLHLPDRFLGYTPFSGIILTGSDYAGLSDIQFDALMNWVRGGGRLALSPEAWETLPEGIEGKPPFFDEAIERSGSARFRDHGLGLGTIRQLDFEPFQGQPESVGFAPATVLGAWMGSRPTFGEPPREKGRYYRAYSGAEIWPFSTTWAKQLLRNLPAFSLPGRRTLALGIALYALVIGPFLFFLIGRHPRRTRLALLLFPLIWGGATIAVAIGNYVIRSNQFTMELVSFVHVFPQAPQTGFSETTAVVISPYNARIELQARERDWFFVPFSTASGSLGAAVPQQTDRAVISGIPMHYGEARSFFGRRILHLEQLDYRFEINPEGDELRIEGRHSLPGTVVKLIALDRDGSRWELAADPKAADESAFRATGMPFSLVSETAKEPDWEDVLERSAVIMAENISNERTAYLAAWTLSDRPPLVIPGEEATIREHVLYLIPLEPMKKTEEIEASG